ncbi:thioredoxin-related transmembrane protein 1-like isoform X1 [Saccostrea echinata]|uniref:thioredoxin-related transmembrane protein 1-like isoform X1 n=1 Tax=Saccostrea echinata TaxID=191078 RepID=UPI002A82E8D8|nr:thioredoxin-related transmembrane protein 1-like isoform X1 [Saccostrea echinata]
MLKLIFVLFTLLFFQIECKPIKVTEENWSDVLEGEWMLEFMAPWCPACRGFVETWDKFSDWSKDLEINVGVVDVTENPGLSGRFLISALPSLYHIKNGEFRQYKGGRKESELISFVDDQKWQEVDPIPWYFSPASIQMAALGQFFKAAMAVRDIYNSMTKDYGIPEWACYVIFAIATILAGLILGLMIVLCCDMMLPSKYVPSPTEKPQPRPQGVTLQKEDEDADGEESETDIIDNSKPADKDGDTKPRKRRVKKAD